MTTFSSFVCTKKYSAGSPAIIYICYNLYSYIHSYRIVCSVWRQLQGFQVEEGCWQDRSIHSTHLLQIIRSHFRKSLKLHLHNRKINFYTLTTYRRTRGLIFPCQMVRNYWSGVTEAPTTPAPWAAEENLQHSAAVARALSKSSLAKGYTVTPDLSWIQLPRFFQVDRAPWEL